VDVSDSEIERGYGATLACIPGGPLNYRWLMAQLAMARAVVRVPEILTKLFSKTKHLFLAIGRSRRRDLEGKAPR
jgi:hypothetical protein